jgi:hypothetical protein
MTREPTFQEFCRIPFDNADHERAAKEGWGLFEPDRAPWVEIQRDDDQGLFESDEAAVAHVINEQEGGSDMHFRALAIVAIAEYHCRRDAKEEGT